jgi:hypothetical protein
MERQRLWASRFIQGIIVAKEKGKKKVHKVMHEFKHGQLYSGSGSKVKSRKQAIAIAMSESGQSRKSHDSLDR